MRADPGPERMPRTLLAWMLTLLLPIAACGGSDVLAVVDGTSFVAEDLAALHPDGDEPGPDERADSVFLLVFHHLLLTGAEEDFQVTAGTAAVEAALTERTGVGNVDERLANRGVTVARVRLEAELDVIRRLMEEKLVRRGETELDLESAYREFISVNAVSCVVMLAPTSAEVESLLEEEVDGGATLAQIEARHPDAVDRVELGCTSPVQHPPPVQPVAVDGEVGRAYVQTFSDGTFFVAGVTERRAPDLEEVIDEVTEIAAGRQGRDLFEAWALELLSTADVEIDPSVGTWEATEGTGGFPTVVAP